MSTPEPDERLSQAERALDALRYWLRRIAEEAARLRDEQARALREWK